MTPMRNALNAGPALRYAHRRVGFCLTVELCTQILGVGTYPIYHLHGHQSEDYQILHEKETLIVPLMHGGEPMAFWY